jgi:hypothetical protein
MPELINGAILNNVKDVAIVTIKNLRYAVFSLKRKLVLVAL